MKFHFEEYLIDDYRLNGFVVFRQIIPASLVTDLRRMSDKARVAARRRGGPQAQRLQPLHDSDLELAPLRDYAELPALQVALERVLQFQPTFGDPEKMAILFEPAELPTCTPWHRDWRDNARDLNVSRWEDAFHDPALFNQANCPLFEDTCTWVVPGSHLRGDLPRESRAFPARPTPEVDFAGFTYEERERRCVDYCNSMPGGYRVVLDAGDFVLYRNTLWHLGAYAPYKVRATLHDTADTPQYAAWRERATFPVEA